MSERQTAKAFATKTDGSLGLYGIYICVTTSDTQRFGSWVNYRPQGKSCCYTEKSVIITLSVYLRRQLASNRGYSEHFFLYFLLSYSGLFYLLTVRSTERVTVLSDHTQRRTHAHASGRAPLVESSTGRRDLYQTTRNTHNRQTAMPPAGFEPAIPASERPQTKALDSAATGISCNTLTFHYFTLS